MSLFSVESSCTYVAWLKAMDPSHQELISVFISWNTERRRPDTEIRVRTPRNRTSWYRPLPETIIILSGSGAREAGEQESSARVRDSEKLSSRTDSCKSGGNPQRTKVKKRGSLPRDQQEEKTFRVGTLAVGVEKMKSELFEAEKSLLQDKGLASKSSGSCATHARQWENPTETTVARRGTERASATVATMATREQVQEALHEREKASAAATASGTCAPDAGCTPIPKREEGARSQGAVPSSFATAETNEQLKEKERKTARERDPRTQEKAISQGQGPKDP